MTFPTGGPGGYPGQPQQQPGYGQPQQGPGYGVPAYGGGSGLSLSLPKILLLVVTLLGVLNMFLGFAAVLENGPSFFDGAPLALPALFMIGGLTALHGVLPGGNRAGIVPAAVSLAAAFTIVFFSLSTDGTLGIGAIMIMIFGLLQAVVAIVAYLFESDIIKMPTKPGYPYSQPGFGQPGQQFGQPGGYGPPSQQLFGQQPGGYGQPGQPGGHPGTPPGGFGGSQQG